MNLLQAWHQPRTSNRYRPVCLAFHESQSAVEKYTIFSIGKVALETKFREVYPLGPVMPLHKRLFRLHDQKNYFDTFEPNLGDDNF